MSTTNIPKRYNTYHIRENDRFEAYDFPKIQLELDDILTATKGIPALHKEDIFMAFLKDHPLQQEWKDSNPRMTSLVTGGTLVTSHLQALLESGRANKDFLRAFEEHIREALAQAAE